MGKHLDINGNQIKRGDVVVIHKAKRYFWATDFSKFYYGEIGIVTRFGCVFVQVGDSGYALYFGCDEVEVIGKLK